MDERVDWDGYRKAMRHYNWAVAISFPLWFLAFLWGPLVVFGVAGSIYAVLARPELLQFVDRTRPPAPEGEK